MDVSPIYRTVAEISFFLQELSQSLLLSITHTNTTSPSVASIDNLRIRSSVLHSDVDEHVVALFDAFVTTSGRPGPRGRVHIQRVACSDHKTCQRVRKVRHPHPTNTHPMNHRLLDAKHRY